MQLARHRPKPAAALDPAQEPAAGERVAEERIPEERIN